MGWFKDLFIKKPLKINWFDWFNGTAPIYNQYGDSIYPNEVVQDCIYRVVCEMKKLKPMHIKETDDGDIEPVLKSKYTRALMHPNPLMTKSDFMEKITFNLFLNYNAFIYPITNPDGTLELYPLQPKQVQWLEDTHGKVWLGFTFENAYYIEIEYSKIIHLRYKYSINELMGGNAQGEPDNKSLKKVLSINDTLIDGLAKQLKMSMAITAVAKLKTMHNSDAQVALVKEFEKKIQNNESGILPLDTSAEFSLLENKISFLDVNVLKFIDEKIYRPFGVSAPIMKADYTAAQYESFYQTGIEPLVVTYSEAFTKGLFTKTEIGYGNEIRFFPKALVFCNMAQTLEAIRLLGDSGTLFENEKRMMVGLLPNKDLVGVRMMSKNYGTVDSVKNMDLNANGGESSV